MDNIIVQNVLILYLLIYNYYYVERLITKICFECSNTICEAICHKNVAHERDL